MKTILKIIGGIILGFVALGIIGIVFVGTCMPSPPEPVTPTPEPLPAPTQEEPSGSIIRDLAYVLTMSSLYSDDADPDYEGSLIYIFWLDTESKPIHFRNIPVLVSVELFVSKPTLTPTEKDIVRSVYKGEVQIDNSTSNIRIPFEDIEVNPNVDGCWGLSKVTVHTPQQGDFSSELEYITLCESD